MAEERKTTGDQAEPKPENDIEARLPGKKAPEQKETEEVSEKLTESKEGSVERDDVYSKILAKVKTQTSPADEKTVASDAETVNVAETAESKINSLVNLATQKGVIHAVKVARHLEDNYTLDEMHDRLLADDLHEALIKKGLLKEV